MLGQRWNKVVGRALATLAAAFTLTTFTPAPPAHAQGLFDALFGPHLRRGAPPPRMHAYADPFGLFEDRPQQRRAPRAHAGGSGPSSGFCVRTCDGLAFPVRASGGMSAAEMCRSFCPAAKTKIFAGRKVDHSVASDGQRYADLDTAFLFRERRVDNCTCNGKDAYGLAPLNAKTDPTLRPGDVVATNSGLTVYTGRRGEFTPIAEAPGSPSWRERMMSLRVTPAAPREAAPVQPQDDRQLDRQAERTDGRSVQR